VQQTLLTPWLLLRQVGHPDYEVMAGSATYKGQDLFDMEPEERARAGLFMSFQSPVEVKLQAVQSAVAQLALRHDSPDARRRCTR